MIIPGFEELELSPNEAIEMAERVSALARNTAFRYILARAAQSAIQRLVDGKTLQERESAHSALLGIRVVETEIERVVDHGTRAAAELRGAESESKQHTS